MSQKTTRKVRRRTDDELETDFKTPSSKKDSSKLELADTNETKNGVEDSSPTSKGPVLKDTIENEVTESNAGPKTRSRSNTPQNKKEIKNQSEANENHENDNLSNNKNENLANIDNSQGNEIMEPLILNVEEAEPELEFDENSESDSHKDSPNSVRCKTRRSQTRNIPTPKTPKSIPSDTEETTAQEILVTTSEIEITNGETNTNSAPTEMIIVLEEEILSVDENTADTNDSSQSLDNVSMKVEVGSDSTRNIETTLCEDTVMDPNSFLNLAKEKSFTETLRRMSSRRPIRSTQNYQKAENFIPLPLNRNMSLRPSVERISGVKRKNRSETPENKKKPKIDASGFFSYISSPINNIKNKFLKSDVPSSTPKLTGYKDKIFEKANVSKIDAELDDIPADKKWCVLM